MNRPYEQVFEQVAHTVHIIILITFLLIIGRLGLLLGPGILTTGAAIAAVTYMHIFENMVILFYRFIAFSLFSP